MPAINFQKRFALDVETGRKKRTFRKLRKRQFKVGDMLYLYTGLRTKSCRKLGESICSNVERGEILEDGTMKISGVELSLTDKETMARLDGFVSWKEMYSWFSATHTLPVTGQLVMWD